MYLIIFVFILMILFLYILLAKIYLQFQIPYIPVAPVYHFSKRPSEINIPAQYYVGIIGN